MALTSYTTLTNSAVQAGGRPRGSTITALRDNPIAAFEGDATAVAAGVVLRLPALQRLTAGTSVRARNDAVSITVGPVDMLAFGLLQAGTIRFTIDHRVQSGSDVSEVTVRRTRAGVETVMQTWTTSSTSFVSRSYDATVQPGDLWVLRHRRSSGVTDDVEARNARFQVGTGEFVYPTEGLMGLIEGQAV